jgi:hypothetical protein
MDEIRVPQPNNYPYRNKKGKLRYVMRGDFIHQWTDSYGVTRRIKVPAAFDYDGASIPRLCWSLLGLNQDGILRAAAAVHDYIYREDGLVITQQIRNAHGIWRTIVARWDRKDSDILFRKMLKEAGVKKHRRAMAFWAIRLFARGLRRGW